MFILQTTKVLWITCETLHKRKPRNKSHLVSCTTVQCQWELFSKELLIRSYLHIIQTLSCLNILRRKKSTREAKLPDKKKWARKCKSTGSFSFIFLKLYLCGQASEPKFNLKKFKFPTEKNPINWQNWQVKQLQLLIT